MSASVGLSALRVELISDASGFGYSTIISAGNMQGLVLRLNTVSLNSNTTNSTVSVGSVYSIALQQAVVATEYSSLTTVQKDLWNVIITTGLQGIMISSSVIQAQISNIWSGTTTGGNLSALRRRTCTRAEYLFGEGATVNINEVTKAVDGNF